MAITLDDLDQLLEKSERELFSLDRMDRLVEQGEKEIQRAQIPELARDYARRITEAGPMAQELYKEIAQAEGPWMREQILAALPDKPAAERTYAGRMAAAAIHGAVDVPRKIDATARMATMAAMGAKHLDELEPEQRRWVDEMTRRKQGIDPIIRHDDRWWEAAPIAVFNMLPATAAGIAAHAAGGRPLMTAFWMTQTLPDRYQDMKEEGLSEHNARAAALVSSAIEAAVETMTVNPAAVGAETIKAGVRPIIIRLVKNFAGELSEEALQALTAETVAGLFRVYEGDAPRPFWDAVARVADQTVQAAAPVALMAGAGGMAGVALRQLAAARPEAARTLADIARPSRKQIRDAGLDPGLFPDQASRAAAAAELKQLTQPGPEPDLPVIQPARADGLELAPTTPPAAGDAVSAPAAREMMTRPPETPSEPLPAGPEAASPVVPPPGQAPGQPPAQAPPTGTAPPGDAHAAERPAYSARHAIIDELRARMGMAALSSPETVGFEQNFRQAIDEGYDDSDRVMRTVTEIESQPRALNALESDGMVIHKTRLATQFDRAVARMDAATDESVKTTAAEEARRAWEDLNRLTEALRISGSERGRQLNNQKLTIYDDLSLASVLMFDRLSRGGKNTPAADVEEYKRLIAENRRLTAELERERIKRAAATPQAEPEWLTRLSQRAEQAKSRLIARLAGGTAFTGLDPEILVDLAVIGAEKIARGAKSISDFARAMSAELGGAWKQVARHVAEIRAAALKQYTAESAATEPRRKQMAGQAAKLREEHAKTAAGLIAAAAERGVPLADMGRELNTVARELVVTGQISTREDLISKLHRIVLEQFPAATREEVSDVFSGYGQFRPLSKDPTSVLLRGWKGELQQTGKLRDMAAGRPPKKSGPERRTPTDEERELIRQVNEAKKRGGYTVSDPERQLKTARDAIKTRLRNAIRDMNAAISRGTPITRTRNRVEPDDAIRELIRQRDAVRELYNAAFPTLRRTLTDEQRTAAAIRAAQRAIEAYQQQIAAGGARQTTRRPGVPETPELAALRRRKIELAAHLKLLREAAGIIDEQRIGRALKHTREQIQKIEAHLRAGTLPEPAPRRTPPTTHELEQARARLKHLRTQLATSEPALIRRAEKRLAQTQRALAEPPAVPKKRSPWTGIDRVDQLEYQIAENRRLIQQRIRDARPKSVASMLSQSWLATKALVMSSDISWLARQARRGLFYAAFKRRPDVAVEAIRRGLAAFFSPVRFNTWQKQIKESGMWAKWGRAGVALISDEGPLVRRDEALGSDMARRMRVLGVPVRASERSTVAALNYLRINLAEIMEKTLTLTGTANQQEKGEIAYLVNVMTGRGDLGSLERAAGILNHVLTSARYTSAKLQFATFMPFARTSSRVRREAIKVYVASILGHAAIIGALQLAFPIAEIETDPRSSDFLKVRIGNIRIDTMGGLAQAATLLARVATGQKKQLDGSVVSLRGEGSSPYREGVGDVVVRSARGLLSPASQAVTELATGRDFLGRPVAGTDIALRLVTPITLGDIYEGMVKEGIPSSVAIGLLSWMGEGVAIHDPPRMPRPAAGGWFDRSRKQTQWLRRP